LSIFTTKLEPILPKIPEEIQFAPPRRRAAKRHCLAEKLPFPLREKSGGRKIKKCKGNFSAWLRATRGRRGYACGSRTKSFPSPSTFHFLSARQIAVEENHKMF